MNKMLAVVGLLVSGAVAGMSGTAYAGDTEAAIAAACTRAGGVVAGAKCFIAGTTAVELSKIGTKDFFGPNNDARKAFEGIVKAMGF